METCTTLITGESGRLGKELVKLLPSSLHPTHNELDITNKIQVNKFFKKYPSDIIIHCAALTDIRKCEENRKLAYSVNVEGTENIVNACTFLKNPYIIYISTAVVFDGKEGDYVESDVPHPVNFYGLTKLLGEFVVKYSAVKKWLVARVNFVARQRWPYSKAFADRFGTYLFADDLALAIKTVIERDICGLIHICGNQKFSMFEIAKIITPEIEPMYMNEYSGPPLPVDMSLRSERINSFPIRKEP